MIPNSGKNKTIFQAFEFVRIIYLFEIRRELCRFAPVAEATFPNDIARIPIQKPNT